MVDFVNIKVESNLLKYNDKIYFVAADLNILCEFDPKLQKIRIVSSIGNDSVLRQRAFSKILIWNNMLIFVPYCAKNISIFDLKNNIWDEVKLKNIDISYKFLIAEIYDDYLYLFGHYYPDLVKVNLATKSVEHYGLFDKEARRISYFGISGVRIGNEFWAPLCESNEILKMRLDTGKVERIKVPVNMQGYLGIQYDGKNFWMCSRNNRFIVQWNQDENCIVHNLEDDKKFSGKQYYTFLGTINNNIAFISSTNLEVDCVIDGKLYTKKTLCRFAKLGCLEENISYAISTDGKIRFFNEQCDKVNAIDLVISRKELSVLLKNCNWGEDDIFCLQMLEESDLFGLECYLHVIASI